MFPSAFIYHRPRSLAEALQLRANHEDAAYLSGGHTLLPAMKNRLASPSHLIDLRSVPELHGIALSNDRLSIGATTTHATVATSHTVQESIPTLALLAGSIADPQVRNVGTIGGSIANNDPAADFPAAALGLGAEIVTSQRRIQADEFFTGMFSTALDEGEIVMRLEFPIADIAGYGKFCSQASRYAMAGSFVSRRNGEVRVAVTGSGADGVFRWTAAEEVLMGSFLPDALSELQPDPDAMISDLHGDASYRAALVAHVTRMAVANPGSAHIR